MVSADRYDEERRQGELIVSGEEHVWGWSGPAGSLRAERRARLLIEQARLAPGVRCLELGCGTGEFTTRLLDSGCQLVAIELSEATAAVARERVGDRAEIVIGNVETGEGLEDREFDAVVGVSVLHHVDLEACFAQTFPHLRRSGRFAFSEPNLANPQVWAERSIELVRKARHVTLHETAFTAGDLRARFEAAGLEVELCRPFERLAERTPLRAIAGSIAIAGRRR